MKSSRLTNETGQDRNGGIEVLPQPVKDNDKCFTRRVGDETGSMCER